MRDEFVFVVRPPNHGAMCLARVNHDEGGLAAVVVVEEAVVGSDFSFDEFHKDLG